jgi:lipopolysaccharide transport protein LptA
MKSSRLIIIIILCGWNIRAQTNLIAPTNFVPPRVTHIDSDSADFDMNARTAIYRGNVHVSDPDMKLTCVQLVANLPQSGRMNHIVAETNVMIDYTDAKGQTMHATSDKAVYNYAVENGATNETVTLTGNAKVENAQGWLTGEPIYWDRANNYLHADNPKMIYRQNLNSAPAQTNSSAANTNELSLPK